jgi:chemotaxis protein histidine kinase CheA
MTTYTYESEKQVLKFYIRLLLYVNDKYSENESSKIDPNSLLGYLHSLKEDTLLQQVVKNKLRNEEMYNDGEALDVSFYDLFNEDIDSETQEQGSTLDTDEETQPVIPPFPKSPNMTGKEVSLTPEQRKMINTIKTNPTLNGVHDYLIVHGIDIQLKFIEVALTLFESNGWNENTPFDKSDNETLIQLISKLVNDEEERKRILAATPLIAQVPLSEQESEQLESEQLTQPQARALAPQQLATEQLESEQLAQPQATALAQQQLAPQQLAQAQAQQQLTPEQLAQAQQQLAQAQAQQQLTPEQLTPEQLAQQKRKVTFATAAAAASAPEQTTTLTPEQTAAFVEQQAQKQATRNTLMANKNPMQKFKILLGPNVISKLRLQKDEDFEKWYTTPSTKSNLILSLDALIQALNTNMKTGKSVTEIFDKSKADMPSYIKSYLSRIPIKFLLATSPVQDILLNVKTNILEIYDYSNGINDFIHDLTEVVNDLKRIANKV